MVEAKKKILKEIITSEEATLPALKRLVESAKLFLKVEEKTGRVIISPNFKFTNADKIFLILLGKYFAKHYEILKDFTVTLSDISMEIGIKRTTLSAPLKRLVDDDVVSRPRENTYRINPYKAEHLLHRMNEKYLSGESK